MVVVAEEKCVGCGRCEAFCPEDAMWVWGCLEIDSEKCTECFNCIENCPVDAISEQ